ncbi:MAG: HD-GYP domain-containing protein, partial [Spirochaetota bacterium]
KNDNEILGKKFNELLYNEETVIGDTVEDIMTKIKRDGSWEGELISKNRRHNWIALTTITPIYNHKNEVYGYVSILHDLSRVKELEGQILATNRKLKEANIETIFRLSYACEARDDETGQHVKRIGKISKAIAKEIGLSEEKAEEIGYPSMMHDIGKIKIPDSILKNPSKPSRDEWEVLKMHTIYGEAMLGNKAFFKLARKIARHHHERWDGTGYPDGLKGSEIPLAARITTIADVYDALVHERVYKKAWSKEDAYNYIVPEFGSHFDPSLKEAFIKLYQNGTLDSIEENYKDEDEYKNIKIRVENPYEVKE